MGILDDALSIQDAKRSQRLKVDAQKAKIESNKIKEGTYRGIDLVDGTAKIQLDGQPTTTSGYRLITNAPLGDGDRVSIRPNGVGLPRADAKNVAPKKDVESVEKIILREAYLTFIDINLFSGNSTVGQPKSDFRFYGNSGNVIIYSYENTKLVKVSDQVDLIIGAFTEPPDGNITANLSSLVATSNKNNFTVDATLNAPFINLPPTAPFATIFNYEIKFPAKQWKDAFKKFNIDFDTIPSHTFAWNDSPIEIEALGGITGGVLASFGDSGFAQIIITKSTDNYFLSVDVPSAQIAPFPVGSTAYTFSFRYRKRTIGNNLPWFSLG